MSYYSDVDEDRSYEEESSIMNRDLFREPERKKKNHHKRSTKSFSCIDNPNSISWLIKQITALESNPDCDCCLKSKQYIDKLKDYL